MNKGMVYLSVFSSLISVLILIILIFTMSSSGKGERFYLTANGNGELVRIDKVTGEIMLLDEGALVPLNDIESVKEELRELNLPKDYTTGLSWRETRLRTKWDGMIYIRINISGDEMVLIQWHSLVTGILVQLFDENGFLLTEHEIAIDDFIIESMEDSQPVSWYAFASFECPKEIYKQIDDWTFSPVPRRSPLN